MVQSDPELAGISAVLFDEVHERSLDGDFGLALALDVQAALRPDLRLRGDVGDAGRRAFLGLAGRGAADRKRGAELSDRAIVHLRPLRPGGSRMTWLPRSAARSGETRGWRARLPTRRRGDRAHRRAAGRPAARRSWPPPACTGTLEPARPSAPRSAPRSARQAQARDRHRDRRDQPDDRRCHGPWSIPASRAARATIARPA
jgi:hypothetical protein